MFIETHTKLVSDIGWSLNISKWARVPADPEFEFRLCPCFILVVCLLCFDGVLFVLKRKFCHKAPGKEWSQVISWLMLCLSSGSRIQFFECLWKVG